ncbi:hypothetical protein BGZ65_008800, partial [Modicella reniformis]
MDAKQPSQERDSREYTTSSSGKGKEPSHSGPESQTGATAQTGVTTSLIGSVASSARSMASALDPRHAGTLGQLHGFGSSSRSSGGSMEESSSKASTSTASRTFKHAHNAIETIGSSSTNGGAVESIQPTAFKSASSLRPSDTESGVATIDWDSFLSSSESTLQDGQPYKPPSMESFGFSFPTFQEQEFAHMSQPMNLTPANHAAFLHYLRSTADNSAQSSSSQTSSTLSPVSSDIQRQQFMDGAQVVAFLSSTSYSDFVGPMEAERIEKYQQDRRTFVYSEGTLGPQSLLSALQLIQHLPSERQDVVQYLLQQGTYSDDVWGRPFAHDAEREEAVSLAATRAEQDRFLQQVQQSGHRGQENGASTEEMEKILRQIVDDAKTEVKTGETNGKALNRLMTVRSRITMAKL